MCRDSIGNVLATLDDDKDLNVQVWNGSSWGSVQELEETKARLQAAGIDVVGITDHTIFKSIYFFDPNGHRLELACDIGTPDQYAELKRVAPVMLEEWSQTKKAPRHAAWLHEKISEES